jgi:hypothetical protein
MQGTGAEQDFVRYLVASQLSRHPHQATEHDWEHAWRVAEDWWERTVRDIDDAQGGKDLREAERLGRRQLSRIAYARLLRLGWT